MNNEHPLTPRQEEFFRILRKVDPSAEMERVIEETAQELRHGEIVRGESRLRGFTPNP